MASKRKVALADYDLTTTLGTGIYSISYLTTTKVHLGELD